MFERQTENTTGKVIGVLFNRRKLRWRRGACQLFRFLLPLLGLANLALAQQTASPSPAAGQSDAATPQAKGLMQRPPEPPAILADSTKKFGQLVLDVTVTDQAGQPVSGLDESNFTLLDNHQPAKIISFGAVEGATNADSPQAILLIDEVNNTFQSVATERDQIVRFLSRNGGQLPVPIALALFSESGVKMDQPTRDGHVLIAELEKMPIPVHTITSAMGGAGAIERYQLSLTTLNHLLTYAGMKQGRKLLLWIGPGWPMMAGVRFGSTVADKHANWDEIVSLSKALRENRTTLYSINSLSSGTDLTHDQIYKDFLTPVTGVKDADFGNLALPVLALQSGGKVLNGSNDLASEIASCVADASAYYTVAIQISPSEIVNDYHALEVKLQKAGLTARTRAGYYNQPYIEPPPSELATLAPADAKSLPTTAKEQFRQALHHDAPSVTDVAFTSKVSTAADEATVEYRIDPRTIEYQADASGKLGAVLDCAIVEYNSGGKAIATSLVRLNSTVDPQRRAALDLDGVHVKQSIALKPGAASLVLGIRDQTTGRFGNLEVPLAGN